MQGIQIDRLKFENYRQYGTAEIRFEKSSDADTNLFAFIAQNGTGKTTILKAITWCLYGNELAGGVDKRSDSNSLPLVNTTTLALADAEVKVPVSVSFRFLNEKRDVIEFQRETDYMKPKNGPYLRGATKFTVVQTPVNGKNSMTFYDAQADAIVKEYFDPAIYNFYFFDGEKLAQLFQTNLKNSIYNIAQVNMLKDTIKHVTAYKKDLSKKIGREVPNIEEIQKEIDDKELYIQATRNQKERKENRIVELQQKFDTLDEELNAYKPVQQFQQERKRLASEQETLEKKYIELKNGQLTFIQKYLVLLNLYPRIRKVYEYISQKEASGALPPSIDRTQILDLLKHPEKGCPLCGTHLEADGLKRLQRLLDQYAISSETSNFLSKMIGPLESALHEVAIYEDEKKKLQEEFRKQEKEQRDNVQQLKQVDENIMKYGGDSGTAGVAELNRKYIETKNYLIEEKAFVLNCEEQIKKAERELQELSQKMDVCQSQIAGLESLKKQFKVVSSLEKSFVKVCDAIVYETKTEMQRLTWKTFSDMTWKMNTFGRISIDDNYKVVLYNTHNQPMTEDASGAEVMALAYAFTLSVHQVSGKNCPLVIDSPLGRVSDEARERMAEVLLSTAKEKQIIMLFTPDEYSEQVKRLYEHHATVNQLKLSSDESVVEGVKRYGR